MPRQIDKAFGNLELFFITEHNIDAQQSNLARYVNPTGYVSTLCSWFE